MDNTNMSLKTRLSEVLGTLTLIILLYAIFLAILGIIISNTELIIQTCIMFVVYVIFEYLNHDITQITNKSIKNKKIGSLEWKDIYRVEKKKNVISFYTKSNEKPYKIYISRSEDEKEVSRIYKYILSKIKSPEKVK